MQPVIAKTELLRIVRKFINDEKRGISIDLFAELCGVSRSTIQNVFINGTDPLTEYVQRRVSKGYQEYVKGNVAVYENRDRSRFVDYRRVAKPKIARSMGLTVVNGEIKLKIGLRNRADYSERDIDEKLRGK